jgi:DNA polymerase I-like protein with 3'-5' exonuclease and polymerase domains
MNYVTQCTAAEELKRGITRLASAGLGDMLRLPVHDEVILECDTANADDVLRLAQQVLREDNRFKVSVPWEGVIMPVRWAKS